MKNMVSSSYSFAWLMDFGQEEKLKHLSNFLFIFSKEVEDYEFLKLEESKMSSKP